MKRWRFQTLAAIALAGLWGLGLGLVHLRGNTSFLDRFEATMTDLRTLFRGKTSPPDIVKIIAIDDDVVWNEGGYPLPRTALARIIGELARYQPKVIVVDLLLVDPGPEDGDQALEDVLGLRPSVIAAAAVFAEGKQWMASGNDGPLAGVPSADRFLLPLQRFADRAAVGMVNVATDQSGTPRFFPMLLRRGDRIESSLPLRVAAVAAAENPGVEPNRLTLAGKSIPTDINHVLPLGFYGPSGTIPTFSAAAVLNGQIAPESIKDRIVVIGTTVTASGDVFPTPFDSVLPGVEVIATAITHLIAGDGIVRNRNVRFVDVGLAVLLPMVLVGLLEWRRSALGLILVALVFLVCLGVNFAAFSHGIWLSASLPIAAALPPTVLFGAVQLWQGRRRAQYFATRNSLLQQFQAPVVRDWLTRNPDFLAKPVQQDAAIVFIDLSGFTALSETMAADEIRDLLKTFHALIDREVVASGGVITSFMGDGAMILFGLPQSGPDDSANAARCCVNLCNGTQKWLASLPPPISKRLGFKVGAHFGTIVASRLGGRSHQHITATGDTVNIASRLMEVAARQGAELALSDEMLRTAGFGNALSASGFLSGPMDTQIRGRSRSLKVWLWKSSRAGEGMSKAV